MEIVLGTFSHEPKIIKKKKKKNTQTGVVQFIILETF
jgi:hypothetical protein